MDEGLAKELQAGCLTMADRPWLKIPLSWVDRIDYPPLELPGDLESELREATAASVADAASSQQTAS
jgi:hypothetical protein